MRTQDIVTIAFIIIVVAGILLVLNPAILFPQTAKQVSFGLNQSAGQAENFQANHAPELAGISGYLNTGGNEIKLSDYLGKKVILVDFWTYTCINCIRTLPYIKEWSEKYRDGGLVVIGVHTPEFDFEKNYDNVKNAVEQYGIKYHVVQDNDRKTWNAYDNHYWPAKYLIDRNGNIVYTHFGEGNYEETENKIRQLLSELNSAPVTEEMAKPKAEGVDFSQIGSPEMYFGYEFKRAPLGNDPAFLVPGAEYEYSGVSETKPNTPYLTGRWKNNHDNAELSGENGSVFLYYKAKNVNIVAGSRSNSTITVYVDGEKQKEAAIGALTLYRVVEGEDYAAHHVEIKITGSGFMIYAFTFG